MYSVFLYNAYWYLKELNHVRPERAVFTLYPGGGFGLHDAMSDRKLRAVCDDARLKRIITTQNVTYRYLVDSGLCEPERITHLFGGVVPGCFDKPGLEGALNARAEEESPALKVCFVAQRYTTLGIEKGYDVFVDIVRRFANDPRFEFHVVGGFTPDLIDLRGASNVDFHGVKPASFFPSFYARMDVIVSPNVSGALLNGGSGSFDGFPTTSCVEAGLRGVAMFLTDPHKMNSRLDGEPIFEAGREFELIRRDPDEIGDLLLKYQDDRLALRGLARRGREALIREFSYERQILPRIALLQAELAMA
jgi:glycosyltransferase involved in cell wall biosynthesis